MKFTALLFALLLPALCGAQVVRVASWNVRNYNGADRIAGGAWTPAAPKGEDEKAALRRALEAVRPDVVVFQEMGPPGYLEELRRDLAREGLDYPYSAHMTAADPERCLAALSRLPMDNVEKFDRLTYRFGGADHLVRRGVLALSFTTNGRAWRLYDFHLKSRESAALGDSATARERLSEAEAVRTLLVSRENAPGAPQGLWLAAGDVNDSPGGSVWKRLTTIEKRPVGKDLRPLDARGESWTYTLVSRDSYERVDLLLSSPMLASLRKAGEPGLAGDAPEASDHRMLYADFDFSRTPSSPDAAPAPKTDADAPGEPDNAAASGTRPSASSADAP